MLFLKVLFDHDRKVDVVTASVNEERTLLGKLHPFYLVLLSFVML